MALQRVNVSRDKAGNFVCDPKTVEVSKKGGDGVEWVCNDDGAVIKGIAWKDKGDPFPKPPSGSGRRWVSAGPPNKGIDKYPYELTVNADGKDEKADPNVEVIP